MVLAVSLAAATLVVYWQVQAHDFVNYDDETYVVRNHYLHEGLTIESVGWAFKSGRASNWHPITWISHAMDVQLFGMNPGMHHLVNVFFHITNTLLLFLLFRNLTGNLWSSGLTAGLFALHPLHVESVAWVAERKDVLSTLFWLLTMMAYAGYTRKPGIKRYLVALGLFVAGLLSKPMLVTLPFVLLLMDYWPLGRFPKMQQTRNSVRTGLYEFRQLVWEKTPFLILAGASSVVTYMVQRQGEAVASWAAYPLGLRVANALVSYIRYVGKMFWPQDLSIFYPHTGMPPLWQVIGAGIVILSISFLAIRLRFKCPYFLFGWLWYLGTLIPVIGLVQIGSQSMADRYTYVPLIGLFVAVAWGMHDVFNRRRHGKVVVTIAGVLVLILLGSRTWAQVRYWRSSITLFEHALTVTKKNYLAHNNLGIAWVERGKFDKAIFHLSNAIAIKPDFVEAYNNLGVALANKGRMAEAVNQFAKALGIDSHSEEAHRNLGVALERQGRLDEAVKHYREAIRIKADSFEAHHNLGVVLASKGHIEAAIRHYSSALKANPRFAVARNSLGIAFVKKGRIEDAIAQFREAIRIDPGYENARNNLKRAVALRGN